MARQEQVIERFREIKKLGRGAFGRTLLVEDKEFEEQVVIKVPHDKKTEEALVNEMMQANALLAQLKKDKYPHPNIVRFLGKGRFEGFLVMVLEYVPGRDLRDALGPVEFKRAPMEVQRAKRIITGICSGLSVAHEINLLHRDIKPENIRLCEGTETPKILDFGISKLKMASYGSAETVAGTLPYMAPEAFEGYPGISSDLWSVSVMLYEMLTGQMPFLAASPFSQQRMVRESDPMPPHQLNPQLDRRMSEIILRGLQKDPKDRFRSAEELQNVLSPERVIARLRKAFLSGKEEESEREARMLLETSTDEPGLYILLGEFCNRRQNFPQAEKLLRRGAKAMPNNALLHFNLAITLRNQGGSKAREAIAELELASKLGLDETRARNAQRLLLNWRKQVW